MPWEHAVERRHDPRYEALSREETRILFDAVATRDMWAVRQFVSDCEPLGLPLHRLDDSALREYVWTGIGQGRLVGLRKLSTAPHANGADAKGRASSGERNLVRRVEAATSGQLSFEGRQYRLIAGDDWSTLPDRDSYEVVTHSEAVKLLQRLQREPAQPRALGPLLAEAAAQLSNDWRPTAHPTGLVLLRKRTARPARFRTTEGAPVTPSELQALKMAREKTWIEICVEDESGAPYCCTVTLQLADGRTVTSKTDENGILRLDGIVPGNCMVSLPELDASAWQVASEA